MDSVAKGLASSLYFKRPLNPSMGWSQPASAHSASQASETHITSMGALAASLVTIDSRYCAHGALMYSTVMPVSFSKAVMWALTWSTAADHAAKVIFSPACAGRASGPERAPTSPAPAEAVKRARRVMVGRPMLIVGSFAGAGRGDARGSYVTGPRGHNFARVRRRHLDGSDPRSAHVDD